MADEWSEEENRRLAAESGKPLEIQCAMVLRRHNWRVLLSTHYIDKTTERIRELDVLAERFSEVEATGGTRAVVGVRALVSAKGFPEDSAPVGYSVSRTDPSIPPPSLISSWAGRNSFGRVDPDVVSRVSEWMLSHAHFRPARPLVALDIFRRREEGSRAKRREIYARQTDRDLFEGLDSAIKAAAFWAHMDRQSGRSHAVVDVPVLVLANPFWEVAIETGEAGSSRLQGLAYLTALYPLDGWTQAPMSIVALVCSVERLSDVVEVMNGLHAWLTTETHRLSL
jgi:hypothetical protein